MNRALLSAMIAVAAVCWLSHVHCLAADDNSDPAPSELVLHPATFSLTGRSSRQQLIVSGTVDGMTADVTASVEFRSETPQIVQVDSRGVANPVGDGEGIVVASIGGQEARATVRVSQAATELPVSFELDIEPILTARGCSVGACHGKARGQNGFQLSLLGFDPEFDYAALTMEARGRRIFPADAPRSLLLRKATAALPHGGGERLQADGEDYAIILRWIQSGMPRRIAAEPVLDRVTVEPSQRFLKPGQEQRLIVTAHYSDSSTRDVTSRTTFQSSESGIAAVDQQGLIRVGPVPGEATIMARYMGLIATCDIAIPLEGRVPDEYYANLPRHNFIDELVWQKLESLGIQPSSETDDAKFLRRAHIDIIGRLPTPDEVRAFLAESDGEKRVKLVDRLLERQEYADHWANKWADLLRPNPYRVGIKATLNYDNWIRESFRQNKPYDQFVRELLTAQGSTFRDGAVTLYRDRRSPDEITTLVSQLFLGVRLECAKCHHHPFERWSQDDFYSLAAYFARVGRKGTGLSPPISGSEEIVLTADSGSVTHPLSGAVLAPRPLFGSAPPVGGFSDPREALAEWVTGDGNPYFAQVIANRIWADIMGRGMVEPVDDLRATNPASNQALLEALASYLRENKFDLKQLIRAITASYVYGLDSLPGPRNVTDTRNYSRHYRQRLRAEVLLDAICDITGVPDSYSAMPAGSRANQIWTHRVGSLFLDTFGRPDPNQDPPCERTTDTTVTQTLHLMNAPAIYEKMADKQGRLVQLAASDKTPDEIVDEIYLLAFARFPDADERTVGRDLFAEPEISRQQAAEDLLWALLNTPEFLFKD